MKNRLVLLAYCTNNLPQLVKEAENRNLPVEVLIKDDTLFDVITSHKTKYVVGVCCPNKIGKITPLLDELGIFYKAIPSEGGRGCIKTNGIKRTINMDEYIHALDWLQQL
jgi:hypothetical protein